MSKQDTTSIAELTKRVNTVDPSIELLNNRMEKLELKIKDLTTNNSIVNKRTGHLENKMGSLYELFANNRLSNIIAQQTGTQVELRNMYLYKEDYKIHDVNQELDKNTSLRRINQVFGILNTKSKSCSYVEADSFGVANVFGCIPIYIVGEITSSLEGKFFKEEDRKKLLTARLDERNQSMIFILKKMAQLERLVRLVETKFAGQSVVAFFSCPVFSYFSAEEKKVSA